MWEWLEGPGASSGVVRQHPVIAALTGNTGKFEIGGMLVMVGLALVIVV